MKTVTLSKTFEFSNDVSDDDAVASAIEITEQSEWEDEDIKIETRGD